VVSESLIEIGKGVIDFSKEITRLRFSGLVFEGATQRKGLLPEGKCLLIVAEEVMQFANNL